GRERPARGAQQTGPRPLGLLRRGPDRAPREASTLAPACCSPRKSRRVRRDREPDRRRGLATRGSRADRRRPDGVHEAWLLRIRDPALARPAGEHLHDPELQDRQLRLRRRDRPRARSHGRQGLEALGAARAGTVGRGVRLGERPHRASAHSPPAAARRDPHRPHDDSPRRPVRADAGGGGVAVAKPLLELRDLSVAFGGLKVIDGLDLHVDEHEIVSVIGPNGAGKTTRFNLVTGVFRPDAGDNLLDGESLIGLQPHKITERGVARTFQTLRLFLNMTVKENVLAAQYVRTRATLVEQMLQLPRARREEREMNAVAEEKLGFFGERLMGYRWNQPAYSLSYANRRRLEIAR